MEGMEASELHNQSSSSCPNPLCTQFRHQHRIITQKRNELEKELDNARKQHTLLYNQVVTRGEQSMMREATTGETGVRLPNGELMTPEKFMARTKMMNQCRESLQVSEQRARQFADDAAKLKVENENLYRKMRMYEDMLNGFDKARHYDTFTEDKYRTTMEENDGLVDKVDELSRSERELKEENKILRRRIVDMMTERKKKRNAKPEEEAEVVIQKRKRTPSTGKRQLESDEEEEGSE